MFRILIVDDSKSVHSFVKLLLRKNQKIKAESVFNGSETAMAFGASEYIMKPITEDILFEKLNLVTGKDYTNAA